MNGRQQYRRKTEIEQLEKAIKKWRD